MAADPDRVCAAKPCAEHVAAGCGMDQRQGEYEGADTRNIKGKVVTGAAASAAVAENGIMYGQNEAARVPKAAANASRADDQEPTPVSNHRQE